MTAITWIRGAVAVAMLRNAGVSDPNVLGEWARDGLLTARAEVERLDGKIVAASTDDGTIPRLFWGCLNTNPKVVEWVAGIFEVGIDQYVEHGFQETSWRFSGVRFRAEDIERMLGETLYDSPDLASETSNDQIGDFRAAKAADYKYADAAHQAAEIIRKEKVLRSAAFRKVAAPLYVPTQKNESVETAIRRAFDKIYNPDGTPIK